MAGVSVAADQDVRGALIQDVHARFVHEDFKGMLDAHATTTPFSDPTGTAGDVNTLNTGSNTFQYHIVGTQDIVGPMRVDAGMDFSLDLTNNDGIEITLANEDPANTCISDTAGATRGTFVVGTDPPFYFAFKVLVTDVDGTDNLTMGFRKAEVYQADAADYDEAAAIMLNGGNIYVANILNSTATNTDTTDDWADGATKTILVICDSDGTLSQDGTVGKCYYNVDGAVPTTEPASRFKFDTGEIVIPFVYLRHDTNVAESTVARLWQSGFYPMGESAQWKQGATT